MTPKEEILEILKLQQENKVLRDLLERAQLLLMTGEQGDELFSEINKFWYKLLKMDETRGDL